MSAQATVIDARIVNKDVIVELQGVVKTDIALPMTDPNMIRTFKMVEMFRDNNIPYLKVKRQDDLIDVRISDSEYEFVEEIASSL